MQYLYNSFLIIIIIFCFALFANKYKNVNEFSRNCNGTIKNAKYIPVGKNRWNRNVHLEDDTYMNYRDWMNNCTIIYKQK